MSYSFIIPYRAREEHLKITVPKIHQLFNNYPFDSYEIIIVEQNDDLPFLRGQCINEGAKIADNDILVIHDVDHIIENTTNGLDIYYDGTSDIYLPIKKVKYVYNDLILKPKSEIPAGYINFDSGVDESFWGAITVMKKEVFMNVNGFNSLYKIWGREEEDLRNRCEFYGYTAKRGNGQFLALNHPDSFPGLYNSDFQHNIKIYNNWKSYLKFGVNSQKADVQEIECPIKEIQVDKWLQVSNFRE